VRQVKVEESMASPPSIIFSDEKLQEVASRTIAPAMELAAPSSVEEDRDE
jgi:hypothetical protein